MKKVKPKISKNKKTGLYDCFVVDCGKTYTASGINIQEAIGAFKKLYGEIFRLG